MPNLLKLAKGAFPVFWWKLGLAITLFAAYTAGVATWATHRCELKHEQQKTEEAEEKVRTIVKEVEVRVPEVQKIEVESAKQRLLISQLKRELDEALKQRQENPVCDLSNAEYDSVQHLAEQTRTTH